MAGAIKATSRVEHTLAGVHLFKDMPPRDLSALAERCRWRRFARDQSIFQFGDEPKDVFFIVAGRVRVTYYSKCGREVAFRDLPAGETLGEIAAIDGGPRSASAIAVAETSMAVLTAEQFRDVLRHYEAVNAAVLRRFADLVRKLSSRVVEFSTLVVSTRIRAELLRLGRQNTPSGNTAVIVAVPTHAEIANRVSTHREAVTRELGHLARLGLVQKRGGVLVIPDIAALERTIEDQIGE